jgi:hypothetical protein
LRLTAPNRDGRVRTVEPPFPADPRNTLEEEGREGLAIWSEKGRTRIETAILCTLTASRVLDPGERRQTGQVARRHVRGPVLKGCGLDELFCGGPSRQVVVGFSRHPLHPTGVTFTRLSEKEEGGIGKKRMKGSSRNGRMLKDWPRTYPFSPLVEETRLIALHYV